MATMRFNLRCIHLIHGLVEGATSKVHFNGLFTEDIQLQRGVKQGCSISAFFSITTQPRMSLLAQATQIGELFGMKIIDEKQLLHQLFTNNTGIFLKSIEENFLKATSLISVYEHISGALLNLDKSLLIQLHSGACVDSYQNAGCKIAIRGARSTVISDVQLVLIY